MIKIDIDDRAVQRALRDLQRRVADMTPAMHAIGQALTEGSRERILAGRDWAGRPFAPNSAATLARKKGSQPLIDSKSFVRTRLFYEAGRDRVEVGSSAVQAAVLQFGARKGAFGTDRRSSTSPASASRRRGTRRNVMQARALAG
ncbi:phage virion morphogenesis protein [Thermomonas sp.]|uniref:phage virion morphogenesis protein n=1 Tax=Thermomonas sp. TaxID=1971895 RepID=UPI003D1373D6